MHMTREDINDRPPPHVFILIVKLEGQKGGEFEDGEGCVGGANTSGSDRKLNAAKLEGC